MRVRRSAPRWLGCKFGGPSGSGDRHCARASRSATYSIVRLITSNRGEADGQVDPAGRGSPEAVRAADAVRLVACPQPHRRGHPGRDPAERYRPASNLIESEAGTSTAHAEPSTVIHPGVDTTRGPAVVSGTNASWRVQPSETG